MRASLAERARQLQRDTSGGLGWQIFLVTDDAFQGRNHRRAREYALLSETLAHGGIGCPLQATCSRPLSL